MLRRNVVITVEVTRVLQYNLTIPVILHGSAKRSKIFVSQKTL